MWGYTAAKSVPRSSDASNSGGSGSDLDCTSSLLELTVGLEWCCDDCHEVGRLVEKIFWQADNIRRELKTFGELQPDLMSWSGGEFAVNGGLKPMTDQRFSVGQTLCCWLEEADERLIRSFSSNRKLFKLSVKVIWFFRLSGEFFRLSAWISCGTHNVNIWRTMLLIGQAMPQRLDNAAWRVYYPAFTFNCWR